MERKTKHIVSRVILDSIAEEMGIEPGDELLKINGEAIGDIFDYQYLVQDDHLDVLIKKQDGE